MTTLIELQPLAQGRMVGMRSKAVPVRRQVETAIEGGGEVVLNFAGIEATQSFIDELVGVLILRHGPSVLDKLIFKSCSGDVKAIVQFVIADREEQFAGTH